MKKTFFMIIIGVCLATAQVLAFNACPETAKTRKIIKDRFIDMIIIHHTSKNSNQEDDVSAEQLSRSFRRHHSNSGYHYVVRKSGAIESALPYSIKTDFLENAKIEDIVIQHSVGRNISSIAIGVVGYSEFTEAQKMALEVLVKDICERHPIKKIERHNKMSPGNNIDVEYLDNTYSHKE